MHSLMYGLLALTIVIYTETHLVTWLTHCVRSSRKYTYPLSLGPFWLVIYRVVQKKTTQTSVYHIDATVQDKTKQISPKYS